jgi:hypothetical protein
LALLAGPATTLARQTDPPEGATIASAQVSGFDLARLSPGLQEEIGRLAGGSLNREQLKALAARIEAEQPRMVAAVRVVYAPADEVRVVFVVAHMRDQDRQENVNARYLIDDVDVRGIPNEDVNAELRGAIQGLIGKLLGSDEVVEVEVKLRTEFPRHDVRRRVVRGGRSGQVRLIFLFEPRESARWLRFEPLKSNFVYHTEQGWGALVDFPLGGRDVRFTPIFAIDNGDDLIEEYSGFGLRLESRKLGTERLGASFEWTTFDQDWRDETLVALAANPLVAGAYDQRSTVLPRVSFAVTPQISVTGGVSITEIEPLSGVPGSQTANALLVGVGYAQRWERSGGADQDVAATFSIRAAKEGLESDFFYTRYFGQAEYVYRRRRHTVLATGLAGGLDGAAPLFERFSLGDSHTLRGWDKYDIAPAGGDRVWHASLEYRYHGLAFFLDAGSVWDADADARVRVASGMGFNAGPFFMTVGFPLNTDDVRAVFATGVRFGGIGVRKW